MVGGLVPWLALSAEGVIMLAAAVVLIRHRRRSRRATGLALAAVLCLAGEWLLNVVTLATWGWLLKALSADTWSTDTWAVVVNVMGLLHKVWRLGCVSLFEWAALTDRNAAVATGPETDYHDPPAG